MMIVNILVGMIKILVFCGVVALACLIILGSLAILLSIISGLMSIFEFIYRKVKEITNGKN